MFFPALPDTENFKLCGLCELCERQKGFTQRSLRSQAKRARESKLKMSNYRRQTLMVIFKLTDLLIMIGSFMAATIIISFQMNTISFDQFIHMRIKIVNFVLFVSLLLLWHTIFSMFGLYRSRRLLPVKREIKDIVKAISLGTFVVSSDCFQRKCLTVSANSLKYLPDYAAFFTSESTILIFEYDFKDNGLCQFFKCNASNFLPNELKKYLFSVSNVAVKREPVSRIPIFSRS
ncbi:MAG: hypothetical protein SRB2_03969 [Desulfobacteraceae bacterium Eth-SRB2]|nr:MAG: hypothetical protein SRB2_03969 [Desulfobacteraceae bacterium Eth-SRB2]